MGAVTFEVGTPTYCYRPQRSCGKVMFSQASVILFTGGVVWQTPPTGTHPLEQTATAADDTHPTGMHSCSVNILLKTA